eukprot:Stramenopile-MAST_4_protein_1978
METANSANFGGGVPPVTGRYSSGRVAEGRRMGASTLVGSDLRVLQKKMAEQQMIAANRPGKEMDEIEAEIKERERALAYEREREAALHKRLELDNQLKEMQKKNAALSNALGDSIANPLPPSTSDVASSMATRRFGPQKTAVPAAVPNWLKYDKVVLRVRAWLKEPWFDDLGEGFSVRKFVLSYFLDNKSIEIIEPKVANSGAPQGCFMKKTKLTTKEGKDYLPSDLAVGKKLNINGRVFTIYDADAETRDYFTNEYPNIPMPPALALPNPPPRRAFEPGMGNDVKRPVAPKTSTEYKDHGQFLNMDGKVLEYMGMWDDRASLQGEIRRLKIKYYLVDDTMEVSEMTGMNSGRDLTSRFRINRGRLALPEMQTGSGVASFTSKPAAYYGPKDLVIGAQIKLFGRQVDIVACNDFTRDYCKKAFNLDMPPNPSADRQNGSDVPGYKFTAPSEKLKRLQTGIKQKIETASNYGTEADQMRALRQLFSSYDLDKSGQVSKEEFFAAMGTFACFGADCDELFGKFDSSGDGKISIDEFVSAIYGIGQNVGDEDSVSYNAQNMQNAIEEATKSDTNGRLGALEESLRNKIETMANFSSSVTRKSRELSKLMKRYDSDNSGMLSLQEFRGALSNLNFRNEDADVLFYSYDADGNGFLQYDEFATLLLGREVPRVKPTFQGHNQWYSGSGKSKKR